MANLSPEERQQYGSVNEHNKLIITKVKDFRDSLPALSSPDVDWTEFTSGFDTRAFLQTHIQRLQSLIDGLNNAKVLHDWDNYKAALTDYDFAKYKASTQAVGYETKVEELAQFFRAGMAWPDKRQKKPKTGKITPQYNHKTLKEFNFFQGFCLKTRCTTFITPLTTS